MPNSSNLSWAAICCSCGSSAPAAHAGSGSHSSQSSLRNSACSAMRSARRCAPRLWMCSPAPRRPRWANARATGSGAPGLASSSSDIGCFMRRRALTRPSAKARARSCALIRFWKYKSPGSRRQRGFCVPRGLRPYLGTDTVQPGLRNRVQSIVEMNREDIAGISVRRALSWAPSTKGANDAQHGAAAQEKSGLALWPANANEVRRGSVPQPAKALPPASNTTTRLRPWCLAA